MPPVIKSGTTLGTKEQAQLYILSLYFLFLMIAVLTFRIEAIRDVYEWNIDKLKVEDLLFALSVLSMMLCEYLRRQFERYLSGGAGDTLKVMECKGEDYENLTFLATYIIPFAGMSFDSVNKVLAYLLLLVVIGLIFVKTEKYYANPTLAIFGYRLYKADLSDCNSFYPSIMVISKSDIKAGMNVHYKFLSDSVCYAREMKDE